MFDDLLTANTRYAEGFAAGDLTAPPLRKIAVVTCMDARVEPLSILGLQLGDAHVLRNAGGRVTDDVIRSLLVSSRLLGVEQVVVMQHLACGMTAIGPDQRRVLFPDGRQDEIDLLAIDDQLQSVRADIAVLQSSPLLPPLEVAGFLYDPSSGRVERIV